VSNLERTLYFNYNSLAQCFKQIEKEKEQQKKQQLLRQNTSKQGESESLYLPSHLQKYTQSPSSAHIGIDESVRVPLLMVVHSPYCHNNWTVLLQGEGSGRSIHGIQEINI